MVWKQRERLIFCSHPGVKGCSNENIHLRRRILLLLRTQTLMQNAMTACSFINDVFLIMQNYGWEFSFLFENSRCLFGNLSFYCKRQLEENIFERQWEELRGKKEFNECLCCANRTNEWNNYSLVSFYRWIFSLRTQLFFISLASVSRPQWEHFSQYSL